MLLLQLSICLACCHTTELQRRHLSVQFLQSCTLMERAVSFPV